MLNGYQAVRCTHTLMLTFSVLYFHLSGECTPWLAFLTQYAVLGLLLWYMAVVVELLVSITHPFTDIKHVRRILFVVNTALCLGSSWTVLRLGVCQHQRRVCWLHTGADGSSRLTRTLAFVAPCAATLLVGVSASVFTLRTFSLQLPGSMASNKVGEGHAPPLRPTPTNH
jgi:hypothetical protein